MMSNFRQLGGTLSAVWFVLVSAGAKEDHLSPATVKNLIRDIWLISLKGGRGWKKTHQCYSEHCWMWAGQPPQENLGLSKCCAPGVAKTRFHCSTLYMSPLPGYACAECCSPAWPLQAVLQAGHTSHTQKLSSWSRVTQAGIPGSVCSIRVWTGLACSLRAWRRCKWTHKHGHSH